MMTIPVSMYHTVVTNLNQLQEAQSAGTLQIQGLPAGMQVAMVPTKQEVIQEDVEMTAEKEPESKETVEQTEHTEEQEQIEQEQEGQELEQEQEQIEETATNNAGVPDATQAVEVMTVEQN